MERDYTKDTILPDPDPGMDVEAIIEWDGRLADYPKGCLNWPYCGNPGPYNAELRCAPCQERLDRAQETSNRSTSGKR